MTVQEYVARQTERMSESLAHFVATTPEDRLVWHPCPAGGPPSRSVLEQVSECVLINRAVAAMLRTGIPWPKGPVEDLHFANGQDAQEQIVMSARECGAAIVSMTDDDLRRTFEMRRGPTVGENLMLMPYRNMAYHAGQINQIQLFAGDSEFHLPVTWY